VKPTLADAANTEIPAYLALLRRGLSVSYEPLSPGAATRYWVAEDAGCRYVADDLLSLLGLVALYETRGSDWQASDEQIDRFVAEFGVYVYGG
jgi:hypothetical protein